jgi:type III pantothenate kinase
VTAPETLLVVDVGNTSTVFGVADLETGDIHARWRISSVRERMADEWHALLQPLSSDAGFHGRFARGVIVSSVVPSITRELVQMFRHRAGLDPMIVSARLDLGISVKTDQPDEVGADRLVNCAFGFSRFGGPLIVIDLGTATKIEAVTAEGDYLGGAIAPGIGLTLDALANRAARLFAVELSTPPTAIGRNTVSAVQAGVVLGHIALIEGLVDRVKRELGGARNVVLTGGYSEVVDGKSDVFTAYLPDLTLSGLHYIYLRNHLRLAE